MEEILLNTAYFAPVSYFSAIRQAKNTFIEQYENFGKQSYRNRCEIMTANGILALTVPVVKANRKTLIKDLKITYVTSWQKLHFRSIESAYRNSPYYDYYIDDLMPFFDKRETFLLDLNQQLLYTLLDLLNLDYSVQLTTEYLPEGNNPYTDLRNSIHPKAKRRQAGIDFHIRPYHQTFKDRFPFYPNLSILDLLFCCGPDSKNYL